MIEKTQSFLLQWRVTRTPEDFFTSLARFLAESLRRIFVCIDRLQGDELTARTGAVYTDGRFEDNVEYALKDTSLRRGRGTTICRFDTGVRHLFPQGRGAPGPGGRELLSGPPVELRREADRPDRAHLAKAPGEPPQGGKLLRLWPVRARELERQQAESRSRLSGDSRPETEPHSAPRPVGNVLYANEAGGAFLRDWGCTVGTAAPSSGGPLPPKPAASQASRTIEATVGPGSGRSSLRRLPAPAR